MITLNKLRAVLGKQRLDMKYRKMRPRRRLDLQRTGDEYERLYNALESDRDRVLLALLRYVVNRNIIYF